MTSITHHVPEHLLIAYAAGSLSHPFSLVVAAHVSMCDQCRATLEAHQAVGGTLLEDQAGIELPDAFKDKVMAQLDEALDETPAYRTDGVLPAPIVAALEGKLPRWRSVGMGVKQDILSASDEGSVRLLSIPPGQAMPDHSHGGLEMTLVLQGSYSDGTGHYAAGDVEIATEDLHHTPVAGEGETCICLAATDAPLRFRKLMPRLLQPVFRI
ncbi:MAG: ChrR family anti-sigma-E factor [Pseudomonadota bacterium]